MLRLLLKLLQPASSFVFGVLRHLLRRGLLPAPIISDTHHSNILGAKRSALSLLAVAEEAK